MDHTTRRVQARRRLITTVAALATALGAAGAVAGGNGHGHKYADQRFRWVGTFDVMEGNGSGVAEITDVTRNGKQLIYTDAENGEIGFVDIRNPRRPVGEGTMSVDGEPTSLVILDPLVLVGVNTSESFTDPSGKLLVIHRNRREVVGSFDLGGQPDSVALAPDRKRAVVVIENERDEEVCVGGSADGLPVPEDDDAAEDACEGGGGVIGGMPQDHLGNPTGAVKIVDLKGGVRSWTIRDVDLAPIAAAAFAGSDLEPEFVDINARNLAVVSFQENNHLAVIDIVKGEVVSEFSAGSADLGNVDTVEDDLIILDSDITKRREPDAVAWIDGDRFSTANEGDYEDGNGEEGGSRGFTVFDVEGNVAYESAESFEHLLVSAGHYNEGRSENKGVEPEAVETGRFRGRNLLFVGSERSNAVGVYDVSRGDPRLLQVLPTGIGPEGVKAIPHRNLLAVSTESEVAGDGIPTMINLYRYSGSQSRYPQIASGPDADGLPIGWVALSGLAGDRWDAQTLYAVSDSFLAEGFVYTVDVSQRPAMIVDRVQVTGASVDLDLEGIAVGPDGDFWLGSEGNAGSRPNAILKVNGLGEVQAEYFLPSELENNARSNGIEGIAVTGGSGEEVVYVAIQRAWLDTGDVNGLHTRIGRLDTSTGDWTFVYYPLQSEGDGGWIGLSELTVLPDDTFAVIERDKGWGPTTGPIAELKAVFRVDLAGADFRTLDDGDGLATIEKQLLVDLLPRLSRTSIFTSEKLEGFAVSAHGRVYAVTDNDGVDDAPGETIFLRLGRYEQLLGND